MHLILWRHGKAEAAAAGGRDRDRALSDEGREGVRKVALELQRRKAGVGKILTSPLLRAHQTAEIIAALCAPGMEVSVLPELAGGAEPKPLFRKIQTFLREDLQGALVLVGHMPDLGNLAQFLLAASEPAALSPGSLAALEIKEGRSKLLFTLCP